MAVAMSHITNQIARNLKLITTIKNKGVKVQPAQIKNHMWILVNAVVESPTFDSQMKGMLTLTAFKFGTKPVFPPLSTTCYSWVQNSRLDFRSFDVYMLIVNVY